MTSEDILELCWLGQGSIFSLIPREKFIPCLWHDLKVTNYAVLSYQWKEYWHKIIAFLIGPDGVKAEFIWIDVFCLNQLDGNRMKTIQRSDEIYYNAKEYHLIELGSFFRGWVLFELSSAHDRIEPKVHHSQSDITVLEVVKERFKEKGFEGCGFTKASDRTLVRKKIIEKYRSIQDFNKKVGEFLDEIQIGNKKPSPQVVSVKKLYVAAADNSTT